MVKENLWAHVWSKGHEVMRFPLIQENEFVGFNLLHQIIGKDYYNINDDLMSGDLTGYNHYSNGHLAYHIHFSED